MCALTRKDIAKVAGVSPSTVSRALSGRTDLLPESTIAHICEVASQLGYKPNVLARRLASNKSFQMAYAVPLSVDVRGTFQVSYFSNILDAVVAEAFRNGYNVTIIPLESDARANIEKLHELVATKAVDGLVIAGLKAGDSLPEALHNEDIPFVLVGSHSADNRFPSVNCSPVSAIEKLLSSVEGSDLYFVHGDLRYDDAVTQLEAVKRAAKKFKFPSVNVIEGNYSRKSGYVAAASIIPEAAGKNAAVFLANDRMAGGFYKYCWENNVKIPDDIKVAGSDDDDASGVLYPALTTIRQMRSEMGTAAVHMLAEILSGKMPEPCFMKIESQFIRRASL
ncbi:MAG: hypothetical protein A2020_14855 [Lentisphaerae bacterium GWF2_45_14]|nr:MAG: hypothetical protein A2020_14855 [Lentisphaerae bacterium GWF2_45_14]